MSDISNVLDNADAFIRGEPLTNGKGTTASEPEQVAFPVDSLPGDYSRFAKAVGNGTLTDATTAGAAVLGGVSAILGTRIYVRINQSWCYHSGLYMMLLAPPSYGKSSVIEATDQPVRTL